MTVRQSEIGVTHVLATCRQCAERWDDYRTAAASARRHADETGHEVGVECVQTWTYRKV